MLTFSLACALGCLVRYGAEYATGSLFRQPRLWGTLVVNVAGSFLVGITVSHVAAWPVQWLIPFCGGLTSYSAAAAGPLLEFRDGSRRVAVIALTLTPIACLGAALGGSYL